MSKERYIAAKQEVGPRSSWPRVSKPRDVAATDRLPPGQKLTTGFPVLDSASSRRSRSTNGHSPSTAWSSRPTVFNWEQFNALPQVTDVSDIPLRDDLEQIRLRVERRGLHHPVRARATETGGEVRLFHQLRRLLDQRPAGNVPR